LNTAETHLKNISEARDRRIAIEEDIRILNQKLSLTLNGETTENLSSQLVNIERAFTEKVAVADLATRTEKLCREYGWAICPICGTAPAQTTSLLAKIEAGIAELSVVNCNSPSLDEVRNRLKDVSVLEQSLKASAGDLAATKAIEATAEALMVTLLPNLSAPIDIPAARTKIEELRLDVVALKSRIDENQSDHPQWAKRIKGLEQELAFHGYRDEIQRLQSKLTEGLSGSQNILRRYQDFLATTTALKDMLAEAYGAALDRASPPLEELLTEVFQRLTQQLSYDQVKIFRSPEQPRRRELRVAASRLPNRTFPPNVLNGQASKALQLVPYFVFSRFQPDIMELDLLLIDDPSESFDTSHVGDLVGELALAAKHAQLFVATHEREKFEPHLASFFKNEPLTKISVEGFAPLEGPKFAIV
jgi:hypothetical protein